MAVVPPGERLSYILTHPAPSPNPPPAANWVYNLGLAAWQPNVPITQTDHEAMRFLSRMNRCGCREVDCGACKQPLYKWIGAVMDWYVTLRPNNATLNVNSQWNDMAHVIELLYVMMVNGGRHIIRVDPDEVNPRGRIEQEMVNALNLEFETIVLTVGSTPPVSYTALLVMAAYMYSDIDYDFVLRPAALADFFRWTAHWIADEPHNMEWPAMFIALRFHSLLHELREVIGEAFYKVRLAWAAPTGYADVLDAGCTLMGFLLEEIFLRAPAELQMQNIQVNIQTYQNLTNDLTDTVYAILRMIRIIEQTCRDVPGLDHYPRWPARNTCGSWRNIERLPALLQGNDPFNLSACATKLRTDVRKYIPPPTLHGAQPCTLTDDETSTMAATRAELLAGVPSLCLRDAVKSIPAAELPTISRRDMEDFFTLGWL